MGHNFYYACMHGFFDPKSFFWSYKGLRIKNGKFIDPPKKNHWIEFYHLVIKETHCLNNKSPKWHDISCLISWIKKEIFTLIVVEKEEELRFKRPVPKFFHQRRFCQRKYARNFVNEHEKTQVATLGFLKWKSPKLFNSITKYKSLRHCVLSCKRNN